jgi:pilus assembly protein CpaC
VTANGIEVLAFSKRETRTVVEMKDGESFAISGLLQDDFADISAQVPWIGDIPVLGTLFRSSSFQRSQSELVVIISAHLVSPTRGEALALPTDRVRPPTESELFLFGKTVGARGPASGAAGEVAKQDFTGYQIRPHRFYGTWSRGMRGFCSEIQLRSRCIPRRRRLRQSDHDQHDGSGLLVAR